MRALLARFAALMRRAEPVEAAPLAPHRAPVDHVVLLDGTLGALSGDNLTSIGQIYLLLRAADPRASVYYGAGVQWKEWRDWREVVLGWGVERQIRRAYGWLASRYRPGDRVFLLGFSRGAFAVRSLAGLIERVGLVQAEAATERNIRLAWRYYEAREMRAGGGAFRQRFCHPQVPIEMVGVFDTVRALGLKLPIYWMFNDRGRMLFHDHQLGPSVAHGFHALALDETRTVFEPLLWDSAQSAGGRVEQVWFSGSHGDVGGHVGDDTSARPLANIPLVWMLERLERRDFALPAGWRDLFPRDPRAPSVGTWRAWGRMLLLRWPRVVGRDPSERLHESALLRPSGRGWARFFGRRARFARPLAPQASHNPADQWQAGQLPVEPMSRSLSVKTGGALAATAPLIEAQDLRRSTA